MFSSNLSFQNHSLCISAFILLHDVAPIDLVHFSFVSHSHNTVNPSNKRKSQKHLEIPSLSWFVDKSERDTSCSHHKKGLSSSKHVSRCEMRGCKIYANSDPVQLMGHEKSILVGPDRLVDGAAFPLSQLLPHAGNLISNNCVLLLRCYASCLCVSSPVGAKMTFRRKQESMRPHDS
jgi:hypothetical protein